jgi:hypothetical protein
MLVSGAAFALDPPAPTAESPIGTGGDFLLYHPDQSFRMDGLKAYEHGNYDFALKAFQTAARYADKPSQAMVASMYWEGRGAPQDRALAYAWMDLAAERGYPWLVATRERYWQSLDAEEQRRAIVAGQPLYAEYGDAASQPRLEIWLRRGVHAATGSHAGFVGNVEIHRPGSVGKRGPGFDANLYYAARFWKPKEYWGAQAAAWHPNAVGRVDVGTLQPVKKSSSPQDDQAGDGKH